MIPCCEVDETEACGFQSAQPSGCLKYVWNRPTFEALCRSVELDEVDSKSSRTIAFGNRAELQQFVDLCADGKLLFSRMVSRWKAVARHLPLRSIDFDNHLVDLCGQGPDRCRERLLSCSWSSGEPPNVIMAIISSGVSGSHSRDALRIDLVSIRCHHRPRWHPVICLSQ